MNNVDEFAQIKGIGAKPFYTIKEAAVITGYSRASLYRFMESGELRRTNKTADHHRVCKIKSSDLQEWVDSL